MSKEDAEEFANVLWKYRLFRLENIRKKTERTRWVWSKPPKTFWIPREVRAILQEKVDRVRDAARAYRS